MGRESIFISALEKKKLAGIFFCVLTLEKMLFETPKTYLFILLVVLFILIICYLYLKKKGRTIITRVLINMYILPSLVFPP